MDKPVLDVFGDHWSVSEIRPTAHGWPVYLGRPLLPGGGRPRQGNTVVLTGSLAGYLERHRDHPGQVDLPISRSVVNRLRRVLGLNWYDDRRAWWEAHSLDLLTMTLAEFARRHGLTEGAVSLAHKRIFGPKLRPAGWWREKDAAYLLVSDLPRAFVAHKLGISVGAVGRLRWQLRREQSEVRPDQLPPAGG